MTIKVNDKAVKLIGVMLVIIAIGYGMLGLKNLLVKPFYTYELGKQAESFLASGRLPTHKAMITPKLQIEYISWSPVKAKTIGVKR